MNLSGIKVGDSVLVFDINGRRQGQPEGGWPGTVTKVGRKLLTVSYGGHRSDTFLIADGFANDAYKHRSVRTIEQHKRMMAHSDAVVRLRALGVELRRGDDEIARAAGWNAYERAEDILAAIAPLVGKVQP